MDDRRAFTVNYLCVLQVVLYLAHLLVHCTAELVLLVGVLSSS